MSVSGLDGPTFAILAFLFLCATVGGFIVGVWSAPTIREWSLRRATRNVKRLLDMTAIEFERCGRLCQTLNTVANGAFEKTRWQRLEAASRTMAETWKLLTERQSTASDKADSAAEQGSPTTYEMTWVREPVDIASQLPNRAAFDANLAQMLIQTANNHHPCGLLLVRVDKSDQLAVRYGPSAAQQLQLKLAAVVERSVRESDLLCRVSGDTLGVLLPSVSPLAGARVAEAIRAAVREHAFRLDDDGPAVLLTASFGYATCLPGDLPGLVYDRAAEALDKSQSYGRNQLHVHDGSQRILARVE